MAPHMNKKNRKNKTVGGKRRKTHRSKTHRRRTHKNRK